MKILGIETSCDETAAALLEITSNKFPACHRLRLWRMAGRQVTKKSQIPKFNVQTLSNVVLSQTEIHKKYGGVVPEVAARQHVQAIIPVISEALNGQKPDLIAVTQGPGLITSLQVGVQTAKTLSYVWSVPLVGVNHLEGHLWSFLLKQESKEARKQESKYSNNQILKLPAVALIVSGGHTELILVKGIGHYKLIGQTRDDAAGEAFDKVAKLLDLGFPGGPVIAHFAKEGDATKIKFPRPMLDSGDFDFSFSGLKTSVKYYLNQIVPSGNLSQKMTNDICAGFQKALIDVLVSKTARAAREFNAQSVILGGGVSANELLIATLKSRIANFGINFYYPEKQFTPHHFLRAKSGAGFTGDNAAMIALAGYFNIKKSSQASWKKLNAEANLRLV